MGFWAALQLCTSLVCQLKKHLFWYASLEENRGAKHKKSLEENPNIHPIIDFEDSPKI